MHDRRAAAGPFAIEAVGRASAPGAAGSVVGAVAVAGPGEQRKVVDILLERHGGVPNIVRAPARREREAVQVGRVVADDVTAPALAGRDVVEPAQNLPPPQLRRVQSAVRYDDETIDGDGSRLGVRKVARVGRIGIVEQMVGGRAVLPDRDLAVGLALQVPEALAGYEATRADRVVASRVQLVDRVRDGAEQSDLEHVAHRHVLIELGVSGEAEARLLERVGSDVGRYGLCCRPT